MFGWDAKKNRANRLKHRVSFEEGATVFADERALDWPDVAHSTTEARFKRLGSSLLGNVLLVVYTVRRQGDGNEEIRIISARFASRKERRAYQG
jgi:uncharacterized DUF497 family protein